MTQQACYFIVKLVKRSNMPRVVTNTPASPTVKSGSVTRHRIDVQSNSGKPGSGFIGVLGDPVHDGGGEYEIKIKDLTECYANVSSSDIAGEIKGNSDLMNWLADAAFWHVCVVRTNLDEPERALCS